MYVCITNRSQSKFIALIGTPCNATNTFGFDMVDVYSVIEFNTYKVQMFVSVCSIKMVIGIRYRYILIILPTLCCIKLYNVSRLYYM